MQVVELAKDIFVKGGDKMKKLRGIKPHIDSVEAYSCMCLYSFCSCSCSFCGCWCTKGNPSIGDQNGAKSTVATNTSSGDSVRAGGTQTMMA